MEKAQATCPKAMALSPSESQDTSGLNPGPEQTPCPAWERPRPQDLGPHTGTLCLHGVASLRGWHLRLGLSHQVDRGSMPSGPQISLYLLGQDTQGWRQWPEYGDWGPNCP